MSSSHETTRRAALTALAAAPLAAALPAEAAAPDPIFAAIERHRKAYAAARAAMAEHDRIERIAEPETNHIADPKERARAYSRPAHRRVARRQ